MLEALLLEDLKVVGRLVGPASGASFLDLLAAEQYTECKLPRSTAHLFTTVRVCLVVQVRGALWWLCGIP